LALRCRKGAIHPSFDHLVGASEERFGNREADRFRSFDIDHQLELGRLLNWQITRPLAFEDATGVNPTTRSASARLDP
jgi:hypothetical protein